MSANDPTVAAVCDRRDADDARRAPLQKAPTGRKKSAQGKDAAPAADAALGHASQNTSSPDGAKEGWESAPLGALCERITKGSSPNWQGFEYCKTGIIFVRSQNVGWGDLKLDEVAHLPPAFNEKEKKSVLKANDVLLNLVGASIGRACMATAEVDGGNVNQAVAVIRVRPEILTPKFLVHFLISPTTQARIHAEKVDVARANFSLEDTRSLSIPLPPIPEQRRIVAEIEKQFTRLEAGVAALRRVQANLKRYRAAVLKAACEGRLVPTEAELSKAEGKRQKDEPKRAKPADSTSSFIIPPSSFESGEALLARILAERRQNWQGRGQYKEPAAPDIAGLPPIPEGWTWASLDQLLSLLRNGISTKPDAESGLPILRISAVRALSVNLEETRFLNAAASDYPDYALTEGDLLFTRYNGNPDLVGVCGVVPPLTSPLVHPDKLIRCKLASSGALPDFVAIMANVGASRDYLAKRVRTTAGQAGISGGDLKGLPIPLAPLAEQTRIVAEVERRLSVVEELEAVVSANLQRATRLRQSILQRAFSGLLVSAQSESTRSKIEETHMSNVSRKTEIAPLDGMPEKRMFWSIIADYNLKTGLTELVDNALDFWIGTKNRGSLQIDLVLDADRQIVTLVDNAGGVRHDDLRLLIAPGASKNSPDAESIGLFGVGSKRAVVAIAEHVAIKTHHADDRSYQIDITKDWLESPDWDLPAYAIPEIEVGTTKIELSHLRKPLTEEDEASLRVHFGETYEWFLQIDDCRILVNGVEVKPHAFDSWAYPPEFPPRSASFQISPDGTGIVSVEIIAGLILDRDPALENYGVYIFCNNRLIAKELKAREVGYYVGSEAGVPHPDASLCRSIVRLNGPAKLMPWNSSKTGIDFSHAAFVRVRPTLIQLVSHFSSLSRRLKDDWNSKVFQHTRGEVEKIPPTDAASGKKLILPPLPRVQKPHYEQLKSKNKRQIEEKPWTLGLVEAISAVDIIAKQRLETKNRIALILLDSNFEIALKEFIVHRPDLFDFRIYDDAKIAEIFQSRHKVISTVISKMPVDASLLEKARHYYGLRNKLIHERATVGIIDRDIENYRKVIEQILHNLFGLDF